MGGTIGVTSEVDHGSTFWFELPMTEFTAQASPTVITAPANFIEDIAPLTSLLVIEDSPSHIHLIESIIKCMSNIQMLTAHTPELGLELARAHCPDLIVCDISLPGLDGFEILKQLRASDVTREIPVIAVSANAMSRDIENGLRAGFLRYLTKPIDVSEFKKSLVDLLRINVA
jgi:CheY-like chemotaxis protein